ncbi:MAG TPA: Abi family protein [Arenibacter sp.]|nr:Abi family protein [Arenibacter sp.]
MSKEDYPKKVLTLDKQITQLKDRGLIIDDIKLAKNYLKNISYFRLQGYWWEFQIDKENHKFKEGTNFNEVIDLYTFDRKLRLLLFDIIERIEIALRTKLIYYPSIELGQWWFEDKNNFFIEDYFQESIEEIEKELNRSKEIFIEKHYEKYGTEHKPPAYNMLPPIFRTINL